jgi:hypothetical protein
LTPRLAKRIETVLKHAQQTAVEYYALTGKPLGITGEIGEFLAAKHLKLKLALARSPGYDAIGRGKKLIQIKTRKIDTSKRFPPRGRMGAIKLKHKWDTVILVLVDEKFQPVAMYEAERKILKKVINKPGGGRARKSGALAITQFISAGRKIWPK